MTAQAAMAQGGPIVISQLFGGGGQTAAGPKGDFVELFNRSCVAVNLDGYSVQVASGGGGPVWSVIPLPNFQLNPGQYYCIRLTNPAIGTDFVHDLFPSGLPGGGDLLLSSSGKAAIVLGDTSLAPVLPGVPCPTLASVVDFVKYEGASTACTEGGSVGATLTGTGRCPSRRPDVNGDGVGDGCQDTNVNSADFMVDLDPCVPRNSTSPTNVCPGAPIFGGCDLGDGTCRVVTGLAACNTLGGTYLGNCTPCVAPQACCLPTTPVTCVVESELECEIDGGVFNPGEFSCPPSAGCPALGRCCSPDGSCVTTFEVLCVSPNTYGGDGTNCTGTPCQGRCCDDTGGCSVVGPNQCVPPAVFSGVGTACQLSYVANDQCPPNFVDISTTGSEVTGFATLDDSAVAISLPFTFNYYGVGQTTASVGINGYLVLGGGSAAGIPGDSPLTGAGFVNNAIYVYGDDLHLRVLGEGRIHTQQFGTSPDAVFIIQWTNLDIFTPSQPNGQRNTFQVKLYEASGVVEMQYLSLNLTGQTVPADVVIGTRETAANVTEVSQSVVGVGPAAIIFAPSVPCGALTGPTGSCCIAGQACTVQSQAQCQLSCGIYLGDNTNCTTTPCVNQACCLPQGGCVDVVTAACTGLNGAPQGIGTTCAGTNCPPAGKCCTATGSCSVSLQATCQDAGSTWESGSDCSSPCVAGACCGPEGICSQSAIGACVAPNVFRGAGSNCNQPGICEGRCCLAGGTCSVESISSCSNLGGTLTLGLDCSAVTIVEFNGIGLVIPDSPAPAVSNIQTVTGLATPITDLDVDLFIPHTYIGDLVIDVEHNGVNVVLLTGLPLAGGCFDGNDPNIVLDDEGTGGAIMSAPCQGVLAPQSPPSYTPSSPLAAFDGMDPNGDWTIRIRDDVGADTGTLTRWSLHVATDAPVCGPVGCTCRGDTNGDAVVNGKDVKLFAQCVASGGAGCPCADMNNSGSATSADVPAFVTAVITGNCGP